MYMYTQTHTPAYAQIWTSTEANDPKGSGTTCKATILVSAASCLPVAKINTI